MRKFKIVYFVKNSYYFLRKVFAGRRHMAGDVMGQAKVSPFGGKQLGALP
jgi:hypothetical protein